MGVATPVIFSLGVIGGDKAKAQIGMIAVAAVAAAAAMTKLYQSADKYRDALNALTLDMSVYNRETKGLIGTLEGIQAANKLTEAGAKATGEQFSAMGKAAIVLSRATGVTATEAMQRLTESVSKGSSRALKESGIDLINTEDLVLAQAEALEKITEKYGNLNVELQDSSELLSALANNWGTMTDQAVVGMSNTLGMIPIFGNLNDALSKSTALWEETGGAIMEFGNRAELIGIVLDMISAKLRFNARDAELAANKWRNFTQRLKDATTAEKAGRGLPGMDAPTTEQELQNDMAAWIRAEDAKKKRPRGGGGRKKKTQAEMDAELIGGYGSSSAMVDAGGGGDIYEDPFFEEELAAEIARDEAMREVKVAGWEETWQGELMQAEAEKELMAEKHEWMLEHSREYAEAQRQISLQTAMQYGEGVAAIFGNLGSLMDTESKKAFKVGKAAAITSATIQGLLAAIKAYQSMASIPIVGPVLGAAAAATLVYTGVVVSKIKAQQFGGGGGVGSVSAPSTAGSSGGGYPTDVGGGGAGGGTPLQINLQIGDESFGSAMVRINQQRSQQGRTSLAQAG